MTTFFHLGQALIDMQQGLGREQRFGTEAGQNLLKGIAIIREALDTLERDTKTMIEERERAIASLIGGTGTGPVAVAPEPIMSLDDVNIYNIAKAG